MDWFTWLSRTGLDPSLVYDYALTFTDNELGEDDVSYFNHEVLQSMGISVAKHRLEILKLARKERANKVRPVLWLKFTIKKTKDYLAKQLEALIHRENPQLLAVPARNSSLRWKMSRLQRSKKLKASTYPEWQSVKLERPRIDYGQPKLMLTYGSPVAYSQGSCSSPCVSYAGSEGNGAGDARRDQQVASKWNSSLSSTVVHSQDGECWSSSTEEIKWDSMFHNLKPT